MSTTVIIGVFTFLALCMAFAVIMLIRQIIKQRRSKGIRLIKTQNKRNSLYFFYRLFTSIPGFNKEFARVKTRARVLYPADTISVNELATRITLQSLLFSLAVIVITLVFSRGDLYFIAAGVFLAAVLFKGKIHNKLAKLEKKILQQFSDFTSELMAIYRQEKSLLEDAIYAMLDTLPFEIGLHVSKIYDIISSPHMEREVEAYVDYAPNNYILNFVSLCSTIKEFGDKTLEDGNTTFEKGLLTLKKQLNTEILRREKIDLAFASLTYIALAPVIAIKLIEKWTTTLMPPTESFYSGASGTATMTLIFATAYGAYSLILSLKEARRLEVKDSSIWSKIAAIPALNRILNAEYRKKYTKYSRIEKNLNSIGNHTGVKAFMVESAAFALGAFLITNSLFFVADVQTASNALKNFQKEFENIVVPSEKYKPEMVGISEELTRLHKHDHVTKEQLTEEVRAKSTSFKEDTYIEEVVKVILKRIHAFQNAYFKWWYEITSLLIMVIAFHIPQMFLRFKIRSVEMSKEDEVNQFNSLVLTFMNMNGIQVTTILEWMERFAYCYKSDITECLINIEMGQQKALEKLKDSDNLFDFRKFVTSLINVDQVGLKEAFADIEIQQDYYNEKRLVDNEKLLIKQSKRATRISYIPMLVTIVLYLILPIILYAISMLQAFRTTMATM